MDKKYKWGIGIALTAIAAAAAYHFLGKKKEPAPAENEGGGGGGGGAGLTAQPAQQILQYQPPVLVMPITTRYETVRRRRLNTPVTQMQAPTTQGGTTTQTTPSGNTATVAVNPNAPQLSQMMADDGAYKDCMVTRF